MGVRIDFPSRARPRVVESPMAPAGTYGFPIPEPVLPVELDGNRVLIRGRLYRTFMSATNAARVASALMALEALDLLDTVRLPDPPRGEAA